MKPKPTRTRRLEEALKLAVRTLGLYAAPVSYHAILFAVDGPGGWFAGDFSFSPEYKRLMPGDAARKAVARIRRIMAEPKEKR